MIIIYQNTDFILPITILDKNNLPISPDYIDSSISINVYTTDPDQGVVYQKEDIINGNIAIDSSEISGLENGVISYEYRYSIADETLPDGYFNVYNTLESQYYLMNSSETHKSTCATALSELYDDVGFATKEWVKQYINNYFEGRS